MSLDVSLLTLLDYSDHERAKWRTWITEDPSRLRLPFQPGGRFPTIGSILDHVFLVERRHLARLQGTMPPDSSGCPSDDAEALFEYATLVRADMRRYLEDLTPAAANEALTFTVQSGGPFTMTRRKLATHMVLHELRHLAQVAHAARAAGHPSPGEHDFFYFQERPEVAGL
jgi:uncharacterized damage-inducible protein DinB